MTYSMDLRQRVVIAVRAGRAAARRLSVSRPTVRDGLTRNVRSYLRITQRRPDKLQRYLQEEHVPYTAQ